jgi:ribosome biogenesis GTPase
MQWGTVTRVDAKVCRVDLGGEEILCRIRGRIHAGARGQKRPLAAGDRVQIERTGDGEGVVEAVGERRSKISRPAADSRGREQVVAANVDRLLVVAAVRRPPLRTGLVDRLLVVAEWEGLEPFLVLNKLDLLPDETEVEPFVELYRGLGYPVFLVSALEDRGIGAIREVLADRCSVVVGHSGVGKSTLLNAVQPGLRLRTGEISASTRKGTHTTTAASLLRLELGGYVVDTPGVREFGLWGIAPEELGACFPEMEPLLDDCRFRGCSHSHEPGCAIRTAVEDGTIRRERYESYVRILESLRE